jgi:hypothetical protein
VFSPYEITNAATGVGALTKSYMEAIIFYYKVLLVFLISKWAQLQADGTPI